MIAKALAAVTVVALIRTLSIDNYAVVVVMLAAGQAVALTVTGGIRLLYIRTEAERVSRSTEPELPFAVAVCVGSLGLVGVATSGIITSSVVRPELPLQPILAISVVALFAFGQALVELSVAHCQAHLGFRRGGVISIIRSATVLAAVLVIAVALPASATTTFAGMATANLVAGIAAVFLIRVDGQMFGPAGFTESLSAAFALLVDREVIWLTVYSISATAFALIDLFVVTLLLSKSDVATFGAAQRYFIIALGAAPALAAVLRVRTSQADFVDSRDTQIATLRTWMRSSTPVVVGLGAVGALLSQVLIPMIDGGKYPESIPVFQILIVGAVAYYIGLPAVNLLMAQRRFRLLAVVFSIALLLNATGDFVIASLMGLLGVSCVAAICLTASTAVICRLALRPAATSDALRTPHT